MKRQKFCTLLHYLIECRLLSRLLIVSNKIFDCDWSILHTYFLCNWRAVTWVSNYCYLVTTFHNWIAVNGHLHVHCAHVNQLLEMGSFFAVFLLLSKLIENILHVLSTRVHIDFLISNFVIDVIFSN